jgi:methanogenic corrinoid protein MtbC1
MVDLAALPSAVEAGDRKTAVTAIAEGLPWQAILDATTRAMEVVGGKFSRTELYVPEMLISAPAIKGSSSAFS